ncbi:copper chaperone PCu(A)C [Roseovarius sp. Pro17]|uniref:copper chaperone PCu(A)C n=1 Tax=Roseovarius sp. Pro17 TaxID=3108175 RepID=UPI002D784704|nr:copper chaperone PCu(A)C [Roseovarius sp. Pro17]
MSFTFRTFAATAGIALALAMPILATPAFAADIMVDDAYARSASPTAKTGAAFMQIVNHGEADRLTGAASPAADLVQLHTHVESSDGVMQMMHVEDGFELPADSTLSLERGGKHVMFMGLTAPLAQGDTVPVTLSFEKAGNVTIDVTVDLERLPGEAMTHDMDHDMDHEDGHQMDDGAAQSE